MECREWSAAGDSCLADRPLNQRHLDDPERHGHREHHHNDEQKSIPHGVSQVSRGASRCEFFLYISVANIIHDDLKMLCYSFRLRLLITY